MKDTNPLEETVLHVSHSFGESFCFGELLRLLMSSWGIHTVSSVCTLANDVNVGLVMFHVDTMLYVSLAKVSNSVGFGFCAKHTT